MSEFQKVAKLEDVHEGEITLVEIGKDQIALYRIGEEIFATSNICTHEQCELDQNNIIEGEEVECTCHGSKFNIKTGAVVQAPAFEPLPVYKTEIRGDEIFVEV